MDHRLIESSGMAGIMRDLFGLYAAKTFGVKNPDMPADFEQVLQRDLEKCGNARRTPPTRASI